LRPARLFGAGGGELTKRLHDLRLGSDRGGKLLLLLLLALGDAFVGEAV
jgi:hypothetical protein